MNVFAGSDTVAGRPISRRARALVALALAVAFVLPIAIVLSRTVYGSIETPLATPDEGWAPRAVDLPLVSSSDGLTEYRIRLRTDDVGRLVSHSEIRLLVATHMQALELERATLSFTGTECVYATSRGAIFPDNGKLRLARGAACVPLRGAPTGELHLLTRFRHAGRPALWTFVAPAPAAGEVALVVDEPALRGLSGRVVVRGMLADEYRASRARRVELLAYVWQVARSPLWIWAVLALSGVLLGAGIYNLSWEIRPAGGWRAAIRPACGAFCAAAGITFTYVVCVPPFQAADEPHHFLGFAAAANRPDLEPQVTRWSALMHLERIHFDPDEHFRPTDRGRPGDPWQGSVPDLNMRGGGIRWLWQVESRTTGHFAAPGVLLAVRATNAVIFSFSVALFMLSTVRLRTLKWPQLLLLPLFYIPTLPYFGMYLSNYALLVSAYVLVAAGTLLLFLDDYRSHMAGSLIGIAWCAAVLISRSALPFAPFIGAMLLGRLVLSGQDQRWRSSLLFWMGISVPVAVATLLAPISYVDTVWKAAVHAMPSAGAGLNLTAPHPIVIGLFALFMTVSEQVCSRIRNSVTPALKARISRILSVTGTAMAVIALALFTGAFFIEYPDLPRVDVAHPPDATRYALRAALVGATLFRFGSPDRFTSTTFWGGFGWLETSPPHWFVSLLAGASGMALVVLLLWLSRVKATRRMLWLLFAQAGFFTALAAEAYTLASTTLADLHGRYLVGLYLVALVIVWSVLALVARTSAGKDLFACTFASVAIHAYCLSLILCRYF